MCVFHSPFVVYDLPSSKYLRPIESKRLDLASFSVFFASLYLTLTTFGVKEIFTQFRFPFTHSPPMADPIEGNGTQPEVLPSSPPHTEHDATSEAPSSHPSFQPGRSWFQQLKDWSPSLVLDNTGSVGKRRVFPCAETKEEAGLDVR